MESQRVQTTLEIRADARQVGQLDGLFRRVFSDQHVDRFNKAFEGIAESLGEIVQQQHKLVLEARALRGVAEGYADIRRQAEAAARAVQGVQGGPGGTGAPQTAPGAGGPPGGGGGRRGGPPGRLGGVIRGAGIVTAASMGGIGILPGLAQASGSRLGGLLEGFPGSGILKGIVGGFTALNVAGMASVIRNYGRAVAFAPEISRARALGAGVGPGFFGGAQRMGFAMPEATQMALQAGAAGVRPGIMPTAARAGFGPEQVAQFLRLFRERGGAAAMFGRGDMDRLERVMAAGIRLGFKDAQLPGFVHDLSGVLEELRQLTGARVDPGLVLGTAQALARTDPTLGQERALSLAAGAYRGAAAGAGGTQVQFMALRAAGMGQVEGGREIGYLEALERLQTGEGMPADFFGRMVEQTRAMGGSDVFQRTALRTMIQQLTGQRIGRGTAERLRLGGLGPADGVLEKIPGVSPAAFAGRGMEGPYGDILRTQAEVTNREIRIGEQTATAMNTLRLAVVSLEEAIDPKAVGMLQTLIDVLSGRYGLDGTIPTVTGPGGTRRMRPGGEGAVPAPEAEPSRGLPAGVPRPGHTPQSRADDGAGMQRFAAAVGRAVANAITGGTIRIAGPLGEQEGTFISTGGYG